MNQEKDVFLFAGWLLNPASCADFVSWSCPVAFMAHDGKPAQTTQATWNSFAELHCGTHLNPRRVHRQYYEYFPGYLQSIAMAQWSKYWLALVTRLLQVGRAAVWMRSSSRGRKKRNWDKTISYCLQNGNIKTPNQVKQWCNQDWKLALQGYWRVIHFLE